LENARCSSSTAVFTSVANWSTSGLKDITWPERNTCEQIAGVHSLYLGAEKAGETFELATDIKDRRMRKKFERNGWRFTSPLQLSVDYWMYRDYIRRSKANSPWPRTSMCGSTPAGLATAVVVIWPPPARHNSGDRIYKTLWKQRRFVRIQDHSMKL